MLFPPRLGIFWNFLTFKYRVINAPKPPKNLKELYEFARKFEYKDVLNNKGVATGFVKILGDWEKENIELLPLPIKRPNGKNWKIKCHKKISKILLGLFFEYVNKGHEKRYPIKQLGCFSPRHKMRNPRRSLSIHSYGLAIDINWATNPVGKRGDIPAYVATLFKQWGFSWGGHWARPLDPMHFQYYTQ